jgi:ATPase subunit of ABC transporter with duplicated ATPase domains
MPEPVCRPDGSPMPAISGGYGLETLAIIAIAGTVISAGVGAYTAYSTAQASKKAYKYNAQVAENQAQIAKQQQEFAARQQRERDRRLMARARAIQGVTGVEVGEGSSLLVDIDNARQAELNAAAARYTGQAQQANILAGAGLQSYQAEVAGRQGTIGAGATLLSGLGEATGAGYRYSTGIKVPKVEYRPGYD